MKNQRAVLSLLLIIGFAFAGTGYAKNKKQQSGSSSGGNQVGVFDYYLLTLSWAPEFCATNPNGKGTTECNPKKHMGLVVHGLWPQYNNGKWPESCASTPPVGSNTVNHMLPMMPGKQLVQHEWAKHGTCSGLTVDQYFAAVEKLYNGLKIPDEFKQPKAKSEVSPSDIEAAFASANDAPKEAFRISCPQQDFSAVQICLNKDLQIQACPANQKECKAGDISVRPVP